MKTQLGKLADKFVLLLTRLIEKTLGYEKDESELANRSMFNRNTNAAHNTFSFSYNNNRGIIKGPGIYKDRTTYRPNQYNERDRYQYNTQYKAHEPHQWQHYQQHEHRDYKAQNRDYLSEGMSGRRKREQVIH